MKKITIVSACILSSFATVLVGALILYKYDDRIHAKIESFKENRVRHKEYVSMHEKKVDISSVPKIVDDPDAWYTKYHFIGHGGGNINGRTYSNSYEALEYSYACGNRVLDLDVRFTTDSVLVLRHDWNDNLEQTGILMMDSKTLLDRNGHIAHKIPPVAMTYKDFKKSMIYGLYTPLDAKDMLLYMASHEDLYVAIDAKVDWKDNCIEIYKKLIDLAYRENLLYVLDRIIVSFYKYKDFEGIRSLYPFRNVMLRQFAGAPHNYSELIEYCCTNNIPAINVSACYVDDEGIKWCIEKGIHVYVAVCDYLSDFEYYRRKGFEGCVTNYLHESDLIKK